MVQNTPQNYIDHLNSQKNIIYNSSREACMYLHIQRRPQIVQVQLVSQLIFPSLFYCFLPLCRDLICYPLLSTPPTYNWSTSGACCVAIITTEPGATDLSHDIIATYTSTNRLKKNNNLLSPSQYPTPSTPPHEPPPITCCVAIGTTRPGAT